MIVDLFSQTVSDHSNHGRSGTRTIQQMSSGYGPMTNQFCPDVIGLAYVKAHIVSSSEFNFPAQNIAKSDLCAVRNDLQESNKNFKLV